MPLINGQKMACEPCIRGHRSTKCTHANERLMVPVRKPGRPLSTCPHPSSKSCSCGQVTAAIPRKQKCGCGSSTPAAQATGSDRESSGNGSMSPTESKASNSSFRVQKLRRGSSRKQSVDQANLERIDPSQINVIPAANGFPANGVPMTPEQASTVAGLAHYGAPGMPPVNNHFPQPHFMFPFFPPAMPNPMFNPNTTQATSNDHSPHVANGSTATTDSPASSGGGRGGGGGCCGGGAEGKTNGGNANTGQTPATTDPGSTTANSTGDEEKKPKSCCSAKTESYESTPNPAQAEMPVPPNGMMMAPFQPPMAIPPNMYPFFAHPSVFTYPPQYGTFMQPLQPEQWRQMMTAFSYGQPVQQPGYDMGSVGMAPTVPTAPPASTAPESESKGMGTSHHCSCGDGCQCVGCAAHPYNEATQNYVRSAWNTMMEGQGNNNDLSADQRSHTNGNGSDHVASAVHTPKDGNAASTPGIQVEASATTPQTPSDAPSGVSEEQNFSANDFFFVTYPFGESCAGESTSCPCGDDCQCIGCVIHNNPDPAETSNHHE